MKKEFIVGPDSKGIRLDKFLKKELVDISRNRLIGLIAEGTVLVDGKARKPAFCLDQGEKVEIVIGEQKNELKPFKLTVNIIYEDDDIIVVDKPTGLVVHPPQYGYDRTLVNGLLYLKKQLSTKEPLRPGVVHRLDKETSGVMVLAKNNYSHDCIVEQFKQRQVRKEYRAIVWGKLREKKIKVELPLVRDAKNRLKMKVGFLNSKAANSEIEVIEVLKDSTYLKINPSTGRMHQIRVHLKFLGYPIVGDKKYGIKDRYDELFLHAKTLSFRHPRNNSNLVFSSPLPERFKDFLNV